MCWCVRVASGIRKATIITCCIAPPLQVLLAACAAIYNLASIPTYQTALREEGVLNALVHFARSTPADGHDDLHVACWAALTSLVAVNIDNAAHLQLSGLEKLVRDIAARTLASSDCREAGTRLIKALVSAILLLYAQETRV